MSRNNYLTEAFKSLRSDDILNEEAFTLDSKGADELKQFLDGDNVDDNIQVIDPEAETPEELEDSYIGKVILDCCVCHSKLYKDKDEVVIDEDGDLANVDEECPFCYCVDGFKIVGEVKEFDKDDSDDDENGEKDDNDEKDEVEVEETEEDEKIEESVSAKRSARMKKKLREAPSYELHPQYDSRKSFYGKARVDTGDKNDKNKLFSYDTLVAEIKDGKPVVYGTYSATTLRHIKDWLKQNGFKAENKAQIEADYMKEAKECKGKKCNIREGKRRKGECKLTEAKEYTAETLAKDIKDAVDWLVGEQEGCVTLKLDDRLAVCVGWSGGYGKEKRDDVIQSTEDPDYAINAGIKVWTSDDMRTDYDYINYPYYENGDVEDTGLSLEADEDYTNAAEWLLGEYDRMSNYEISDDGEIIEETEETVEEGKKVNEAYYDTTRVLEIVSPKTRARLKGIIDTQKQKYGNDMEISVMLDSPSRAHLNCGEGGADYRKDTDGKWKHDIGYIKIDSALADAIISDVCKAVGMCEKMNESVEEVKVTTETDEVNVKTEDGKVTVETQKREDEEKKDEEVIEPVSDEVKSEIEAGSEKEIDGEFGDEVEVDMDDFDEESFDELGEAYLKKAYSNVESYKSVSATANDNRITVEGVIKFKSGNEKKTKFVLESKEVTRSGKSRFVGENLQIAKGKKAFTVFGTLSEGRFVTESLGYDYRAKDKNGKSKRISGTVTKR